MHQMNTPIHRNIRGIQRDNALAMQAHGGESFSQW